MTLRVIGYIRVSTKDQGKSGYGLGVQHDSLRQFCEQHGYEMLTVTSDVVSGADSARMYGREVAIAAIETGVAGAAGASAGPGYPQSTRPREPVRARTAPRLEADGLRWRG